MRLPEPFAERMRRELGAEEAERLFVALNDEPSVAVRLNPRKAMAEKWGGRGVPWSRDGYVLAERPSFTLDPDFHAGAYYVQEAASQFAGYILAEAAGGAEACRGMRVLDMCAAPGGKSTHYASLVGREGLVVANEINRGRAAVLADNARKWGAGNMVVACNDSARVAAFEEWFDAVAVDAPCSGEGMFRKSEEACAQWSEAGVAMCAERQTEILRNAFRALRAGGILIYSTCTFNRTEDEEVLRRACAEFGDELCAAPPVAVDPSWGVATGEEGAFSTFRFFPHRVSGEGMFLAVARKSGEPAGDDTCRKGRRARVEPLGARWRADAFLRGGGESLRLLCRALRRCGGPRGDALGHIFGCRDGARVQGAVEARRGVGSVRRSRSLRRRMSRCGLSDGSALSAQAGYRRLGAGRGGEYRDVRRSALGIRQTHRRQSE